MENTCKKCNETKDIILFVKNKICPKGVTNECKQCQRECFKEWYSKNLEKVKNKAKKWHIDNPDKVKIKNKKWLLNNPNLASFSKKKWRLNNPESVKEIQKKTFKKSVDLITNSYVKGMLNDKGFDSKNITPELIDVQRIIIKTKRLCKTSQI